jgi:hypothetical protein
MTGYSERPLTALLGGRSVAVLVSNPPLDGWRWYMKKY